MVFLKGEFYENFNCCLRRNDPLPLVIELLRTELPARIYFRQGGNIHDGVF